MLDQLLAFLVQLYRSVNEKTDLFFKLHWTRSRSCSRVQKQKSSRYFVAGCYNIIWTQPCNFSIFNQFNNVFFCSANVKRIPLANRHESVGQIRTNSLRSHLLNIPIMLFKLAVRATEMFTEASLSYQTTSLT